MNEMKYCEYFDINETYFPCIDESAINAGVDWKQTYPHETFIKLLKTTENMLGGATKRSIWIHGAYGTGKSQCAYALKKILEVPEDELRAYWDRYEPLKKEMPLLGKLLGHKEKGIVTAFRYASGSIDSPQQLFLAVQESIKGALEVQGISYKGENTLKESVINWMEQPAQKAFVNSLLEKPEWKSLFAESSADEIVNKLRKNVGVPALMNNIFRLASREGITALSLDADQLRAWIKDIIETNVIKIVLVWDEFSDFFRLNKNSLGEFQKVVSICEELPFYLIVVTHPITSISSNDDSWKIVQQRFDRIEIELPENIAFDLIGHAFNVKEAARAQWNSMTGGLEATLPNSITAVMRAVNITDRKVMRQILPLHPFAALILKNIAHAFQSNQRSMFDFIKTSHDTDVKAFQWFISQYGPMDDEQPLLTVDMLWDFFYVKGKEYLTADIKIILDTFSQQTMLTEKEKKVLKAVLIMQAIDQRLGGTLPILKPTDQNLSYAFEGISEYENSAKNIAKGLEQKGVLISTPIGDGKKVYGAAVLAGDSAKIEQAKNDIRKKSTTSRLVEEGDMLPTSLSLSPALKLRYALASETGAMQVVTVSDFARVMDVLKNKDDSWRFYAVLALAKDEDEAQRFRALIKRTIANEDYKKIIVIDALSSPLGLELFEQYVEYSAMAIYYQGNNIQQAKDNSRKAKDVLNRAWRDKIHDGQFFVYTYANQDGFRSIGANDVQVTLQTLVLNKFKYVFDFTKGLTETQLKLTTTKQVARYGMGDLDIKGLIAGCEKSVLGLVWNREKYWLVPELQGAEIVALKKAVDATVEEAFASHGQISIDEIYDLLQDKYGFSPCNLSAFLTGFLLKEYNSDPYRCVNAEGYPEAMTPDKLAEMIGNCIGKSHKVTYIVKMTQEEKAFYDATETAWGVPATACSSPSQVSSLLSNKIRDLGYPIWCLEEVDTLGVFDIVKKYIGLVQSVGNTTHNLAIEIGKIMMQKPTLAQNLAELLTSDKCKDGMREYLKHFESGKLVTLAAEIGAENLLLSDIKKIFSIKHSALWESETGQEEIRKLITEYEVVKITNQLLNVSCPSKDRAFREWREQLKFICVSCDALRLKRPTLDKVLALLLKIVNNEDILPDMMRELLAGLTDHRAELQDILKSKLFIFEELYGAYLEGFTDIEKEEIQASINSEMFTMTATASNQVVKQAAETYRKNQIKTQLFNSWKSLTGSKTPREWSIKFQIPILCLVEPTIFGEAKKAFTTLNSSMQSDSEIRAAMEFLNNNAGLFDAVKSEDFRNQKFMEVIVGNYTAVLSDIQKIKAALDELPIDAYDWYDHPLVKRKIQAMANAEYFAGGSDKAMHMIDEMSDAELKKRLKELVQKDIDLGVKIIMNGGK